MRNDLNALVLFIAGMMLAGNAFAQTPQTPAAQPSTAPATSTAKSPAKKAATAATAKKAPAPLTTRKDKFSYALGMSFGNGLKNNLKKQSVEADPNLVMQG